MMQQLILTQDLSLCACYFLFHFYFSFSVLGIEDGMFVGNPMLLYIMSQQITTCNNTVIQDP